MQVQHQSAEGDGGGGHLYYVLELAGSFLILKYNCFSEAA